MSDAAPCAQRGDPRPLRPAAVLGAIRRSFLSHARRRCRTRGRIPPRRRRGAAGSGRVLRRRGERLGAELRAGPAERVRRCPCRPSGGTVAASLGLSRGHADDARSGCGRGAGRGGARADEGGASRSAGPNRCAPFSRERGCAPCRSTRRVPTVFPRLRRLLTPPRRASARTAYCMSLSEDVAPRCGAVARIAARRAGRRQPAHRRPGRRAAPLSLVYSTLIVLTVIAAGRR